MAQSVDSNAYYGKLFQADKKPTVVLDALLRGIANYIVSSVPEDGTFAPILTVCRFNPLATKRRNALLLASSRCSINPLVETMTVRPAHHILHLKSSKPDHLLCHSPLCRCTIPFDLLDICLHWLSTYFTAFIRRFQAAKHPRPHPSRLCAMAVDRDIAWARRTCAISTERGAQFCDKEPRHRGEVSHNVAYGIISYETRWRNREVACCLRREAERESNAK